jgi:hypothetical protein
MAVVPNNMRKCLRSLALAATIFTVASQARAVELVPIYFLGADAIPPESSLKIKIVNFNRVARVFGFEGRPRDPAEHPGMQRRKLRRYLVGDLKKELGALVQSKLFRAYLDSSDRGFEEFAAIPAAKWAADIQASPYELRKQCTDSLGVGRDAVAEMGAVNSAICIDQERVLKNALATFKGGYDEFEVDAVAKALLFHEHAHHFGILDSDGKLYRSVLSAILELSRADTDIAPRVVWTTPEFAESRRAFRNATDLDHSKMTGQVYRCTLEARDETRKKYADKVHFVEEWFNQVTVTPDSLMPGRISLKSSAASSKIVQFKNNWLGFEIYTQATPFSIPGVASSIRKDRLGHLRIEIYGIGTPDDLPAVSLEFDPNRAQNGPIVSIGFGNCVADL